MTHWIPALAGSVAAIAALVVAALRRPEGRGRAACFGLATAISYAMTAALMKTSMHTLDDRGVGAFFTTWQTYGFALFGVCALFFLENAMQSGPLVASQPALTLGDACVRRPSTQWRRPSSTPSSPPRRPPATRAATVPALSADQLLTDLRLDS
ncbi:hypothetical protein STENM223S_06389 [Streptomyces tendae]